MHWLAVSLTSLPKSQHVEQKAKQKGFGWQITVIFGLEAYLEAEPTFLPADGHLQDVA